MELWIGALNLGFLYAFMTMGVFFTFRIHDFPDITVDGSFTSGAAIAAVLLITGWNPVLALGAAFVVSGIAGAITAYINTRFNVNGLLAGILVMTGLYSINLHIMGRSNIPLLNQTTVFTWLEKLNPGMHAEVWTCMVLCVLMAVFWLIITLFLKTDLGIAMRATGNNPVMASANGVNVGWMTIFGVAFANGMVGVSGGLVAQYQGFADIGMGIGTVVIGLAAVIIGESVFRFNSIGAKVCSVVIGSVIFRMIIAIALYVGMNPIDLKLLTAVFVFLTLVISKSVAGKKLPDSAQFKAFFKKINYQTAGGICVSTLIVFGALYGLKLGFSKPADIQKKTAIGIVQFAHEPNVELCKQGILKALADNGYTDGKNIEIIYGNAQADFSSINSIIQDFLRRKVAIITPLSTPCVQAAVKFAGASTATKVVFTYIYDPYRIGAAKTPTDHQPNMTGVACFPPVEQMLALIQEMLPDRKKVGVVWNSSEANSESVVLQLRSHAKKKGLEIVEATVTSPAEVLEASRSLLSKGAQVFLCSGDNTVNVGYDSFQKAATEGHVPVFSFDSEFIEKGAFAVLGPDYYQTGYEGGEYLTRVLKGENTARLPILQTGKTHFIFSPDAASALGIKVQPEPLKKAEIWQKGKITASEKPENAAAAQKPADSGARKKLALFLFSDHMTIRETARGIQDELEQSGTIKKFGLSVDVKNAQNEFHIAQSIAQEIVGKNYDYIITVTTPALQATANVNKKIPHIFGAVTDPYRMGVAKNSKEHIPNITGIATVEPVERTIQVMREIFPKAKRIGIIWNPGEACSETCTYKARSAAKEYGFELLETTVSTTAEVRDALNSLLGKIDLFITSGDNTAIMALDSIAAVLRQHKIPYFTNAASDIDHGSFISIGPDYYQIGRETARMAQRVIGGEKPADIPIADYAPDKVFINFDLVKEYGITLPESVLRQAANSAQAQKTPDAGPKRLVVFRFSDNALLLEISRGFMEFIDQSGADKKYNLTIDIKSAQNEFSMAQSILQDIVRQKYDYLVTISTPALQVAAQVNKTIPHIFGGVTDPYRMGVAKSQKDHLPQLTGVATFQPVGSLFKAMREIFPNAKRVGIVWNPGEACSEACTFKAREAAKEYGFELVEATVSSTSEVIDAVRTVINKKIDLFVTSGDNTVILAYDMIAAALHQARIPYCTNAPADVDRGAFLSVGADYIEVGRETAKMALRVVEGENPKDIPINNYVPEKTAVNRALAREYGIALPDSVVKSAAFIKN